MRTCRLTTIFTSGWLNSLKRMVASALVATTAGLVFFWNSHGIVSA